MRNTIVIAGLGAQTPLGLSWPAIAAAVRAGFSSFHLSEHLRTLKNGEPFELSGLRVLPPGLAPLERIKFLAVGAAREALTAWMTGARGADAQEIPVMLSLPPERPGFPASASKQLARDILSSLPVQVDRTRSSLIATGSEGGLAALGFAAESLRSGQVPAFLVGGADTHMDIELLHWLERQGRIMTRERPEGFVPGEGAGFVLLCTEEAARRRRLPVFATLLGTGRSEEPRCWWTDHPTIGEGLTEAFQAAFQDAQLLSKQVHLTYSDLNGEMWRADEWSYAYVRTGKQHASPLNHKHPALQWGEQGAATGPLLVGMAALDLNRYHSSPRTALLWAASDFTSLRSACLIRGPEGAR